MVQKVSTPDGKREYNSAITVKNKPQTTFALLPFNKSRIRKNKNKFTLLKGLLSILKKLDCKKMTAKPEKKIIKCFTID